MAPTTLQKAERDRESIKTTLAWLNSKLQDHSIHPITESQLQHYISMTSTTQEEVISTHKIICEQAPSDMDPHNQEYIQLLDLVSAMQCGFEEIRRTLATATVNPATGSTSEMRLPRIELPKFSGNLQDWMPFRDLFVSTVHNNSQLSKAQKLTYLKSSLLGEAATQIKASSLSDANYDIAWSQLTERYHNDRELLFTILQRFVSQPSVQIGSSTAIRQLIDVSKECIRSLDVLKRAVKQWDDILMFHIFQKLDQTSKELWEQSLKDSAIPPLQNIIDFLEQRARALAARGPNSNKSSKPDGTIPKKVNVHLAQSSGTCKACNNNHFTFRCTKFLSMSIQERIELVKKLSLCFNCLRDGHSTSKCNNILRCLTCNGKHHTLLHKNTTNDSSSQNSSLVLNHHSNDTSHMQQTLLATALIHVQDHHGQQQLVRVLLDGGSTASFITESCSQKLGLPRSRVAAKVSGLAVSSVGTTTSAQSLVIRPHFASDISYVVNCLILPKITGKLPIQQYDPANWPHLQGLQLADPLFYQPANIDILLGSNLFWTILLDGRRKSSPEFPIAVRSTLGWLVAGNINTRTPSHVLVHYGGITLDERLQQFWEIESIPSKRELTIEEQNCEDHFSKTHVRTDTGRFIVQLPFKTPPVAISQSRDHAIRRFKSLERRFATQPNIQQQYVKFMKDYLELNHMEIIPTNEITTPTNPVTYIPHHFVVKESSTTTKFRVVFDASAKTSTGASLNDSLMVGPTIQDNLVTILTRFRTHVVAFTADVAKMYRQIRVTATNSDMQRIVWREDSSLPLKDYRLLTVTYGTASAPFLATRALQQLAQDEKSTLPLASEVALNDFYVDDVMSGGRSVEQALEIQNQLLQLTSKGGFQLRKWSSNSQELLERLPPELRETNPLLQIETDPTIKALGVFWNPAQDIFLFRLNLSKDDDEARMTKRKLLSEIAKIFDPLGWLAPVVIRSKIMLQQLWSLKIGWDDYLPATIEQDWKTFKNNLFCIEQLKINRCALPADYIIINLCGFCDASVNAYAAVVYLCVYFTHRDPVISILSSKTRVAPVKTISLPKLELCSATLISQLMVSVESSLRLQINNKHAWSDSTVTLSWINSHPSRWKVFVANRVTEIQRLVPANLWGHVKGVENPADCSSRGIDPTELTNHPLWWHGPPWLKHPNYPTTHTLPAECPIVLAEERSTVVCCTAITCDIALLERFSSLRKLKRVIAWIFRFYNNCRIQTQTNESAQQQRGPLSVNELKNALTALVKSVQLDVFSTEMKCLLKNRPIPTQSALISLNPFLDSSSVLRVGGRLCNATIPVDQKTPIVLPRHHRLTQLIILSKHLEHHHAGTQLLQSIIQQSFWIIRAKDAIRHQVRQCTVCTRHRATTVQQMMGNLPLPRVTPSAAFSKSGVDFAGPFTMRAIPSRSKVTFKAYLALFVCFATRAVHLEVVSSLSTDAFLAALKRFFARRGRPTDIFSDCGTNLLVLRMK